MKDNNFMLSISDTFVVFLWLFVCVDIYVY